MTWPGWPTLCPHSSTMTGEATPGGPGPPGRAATDLQNALVTFVRTLRAAGLTVGTERLVSFGRAAAALGPDTLDDLYWSGRLTLISSPEELATYDRVFAACFGEGTPEPALRREPSRVQLQHQVGQGGRSPRAEEEAEPSDQPAEGVLLTAASPDERLRQRSFEAYTPEEHARARLVMERLAHRTPRRRSRRTRASRRRGVRPDLARTLRRSLRTGGEPLERAWRRRRTKPRRTVMVLDVSGSMGAYARPLIQFAHALVMAGRPVEVFAFGTRLTRLTPALHSRNRDAVLQKVGEKVPDWQGGTRIGESLWELLDRWGRRGPLRGAVVVLVSDGLERGDPALLASQMERLGRLAHRIIWVNPLKGSPDYEPLARGMAAALPYVDAFLPGHNLGSLEALAEALQDLGA